MFEATNPSLQRTRLHPLEQQASAEGFWDQQEKAAGVNQEMSEINDTLQLTSSLQDQIDNVATAVELIEMEVSLHDGSSCPTEWHLVHRNCALESLKWAWTRFFAQYFYMFPQTAHLCMCLLTLQHCVLLEQESDSNEEDAFKSEALLTLDKLTKALDQWETQQLLGGQYDKLGAVLSIQVAPCVPILCVQICVCPVVGETWLLQ